jgi:hypothetical protein
MYVLDCFNVDVCSMFLREVGVQAK